MVIILVDADGVVQKTPAGWLDRMVERIGLSDREPREVLAALFAAEGPSLTGDGDLRTAVAALLAEWDRADTLDALLEVWLDITVDEDVLAIVGQMRAAGIRCCLATNQQNVRAAYMRSLYDAHFDEQFYSCEIGAVKTDPAYFATVLERLDIPAEQIIFIDDSPANIAVAQQIGVDARLFQEPFDWAGVRNAALLRRFSDRNDGSRLTIDEATDNLDEARRGRESRRVGD